MASYVHDPLLSKLLVEPESLDLLSSTGAIADALPHAFLVFDASARLLRWNRQLAQMLGALGQQIGDLEFSDLFRSPSATALWRELLSRPNEPAQTQQEMLTCPSGKQIPLLLGAACMDLNGTRVVVIGATDLSEQHAAERKLRRLAYFDPLTRLPNRAGFRRELGLLRERHAAAHTQLAIAVVDIDRFRVVNDAHGHEGGNQLLEQLAARLKAELPSEDLIGHLGEDEFAILFSDVKDDQHAYSIGLRLVEMFRQSFEVNGERVIVSVCVGIAPVENGDPSIAMRNADTALYRAKEAGSAQVVVYDRAMRESNELRLRLETKLRNALRENQLRLVFQPILELESGKVVGHEALMRWSHPNHGAISPAYFIPLAERCGIAPAIDAWTLSQSIGHLRADGGFVNVNVSARTLTDSDWVEMAIDSFHASGLRPGRLRLEITETALLSRDSSAHAHLQRLSLAGMPIVLDDFGTGYSSLSHLQDYPISGVKIDRSFVACIDSNGRERRIVSAVTRLAQDLGFSVTAEGVETEAQHAALIAAGCVYGQGHYYGHPLPWEDRRVAERQVWKEGS